MEEGGGLGWRVRVMVRVEGGGRRMEGEVWWWRVRVEGGGKRIEGEGGCGG